MDTLAINNSIKYSLDSNFDIVQIPRLPGVYCFLSQDGNYLYVGKAKNLRNRIASYFRKGNTHPAKTALMLKKASFLDIFITKNEKEALILEAQLIGDLKPKYNIRLRDDKAYPFIKLGIKNPYPRISIARKKGADGALYFGPFTSSDSLRKTLNIISTLFKLRTCSDSSMKRRARPCIKYQINRCSGPCTKNISKEDYLQDVERAKEFLQGKTKTVLNNLKKQMAEASSRLEFERAAQLRDKIKAIESFLEIQTVVSNKKLDFDVIYIQIKDSVACAAILHVKEGILRSKEAIELEASCDIVSISTIYSQFIRLYYKNLLPPKEIVLPIVTEDRDELENYLTSVSGSRVKIISPKTGKKKALLETASINATQHLLKYQSKIASWHYIAKAMKSIFKLHHFPNHIEGIDISNTSGTDAVGSLVCFKNGRAEKSGYRHYNINSKGPDDYLMIYEVVKRRFLSKRSLPDLFIIDGGLGQLSMALKAAAEFSMEKIPDFVSIAKEREGEGEKIYISANNVPIILDKSSPVLRFCQMVRDEAHRFGVNFHRKKRAKRALSTCLSEIKGLGPKRIQILLRHFGSIDGIKRADIKELEDINGISRNLAETIYNFFHRVDNNISFNS